MHSRVDLSSVITRNVIVLLTMTLSAISVKSCKIRLRSSCVCVPVRLFWSCDAAAAYRPLGSCLIKLDRHPHDGFGTFEICKKFILVEYTHSLRRNLVSYGAPARVCEWINPTILVNLLNYVVLKAKDVIRTGSITTKGAKLSDSKPISCITGDSCPFTFDRYGLMR